MCKISVIMPVYNGEKYLNEAIDSIIYQTFRDFELIIIDDASTDNTSNIIKSYNDDRIVFIKNNENLGIAKTLNKGIEIAKGKYIARMDADDISYKHRLDIQYKFMEDNTEVGMCGSSVEMFSEKDNNIKLHECPTNYEEIKVLQIFNTAFAHPTVMIRKNILDKYNLRYDEFYEGMEDYELWTRMSKITKLSNIEEALLKYRIHSNQITKKISDIQYERMKLLKERILMNLSSDFTKEDAEILLMYSTNEIFKNEDKIYMVFNLFEKVIKANLESKIYDDRVLRDVISYNVYWAILKLKNEYGKKIKYKDYKRLMKPYTRFKAMIKVN